MSLSMFRVVDRVVGKDGKRMKTGFGLVELWMRDGDKGEEIEAASFLSLRLKIQGLTNSSFSSFPTDQARPEADPRRSAYPFQGRRRHW